MRIGEWWKKKRERWMTAILLRVLSPQAMESILWEHRELFDDLIRKNRMSRPLIYGSEARLHIDDTAVVNNASFNTLGGEITIGAQAFLGHDVSLLTGTHDIQAVGEVRKESGGGEGRDIVIQKGAWLATRVVVVGPVTIGENAVVGVGSVVLGDVEAGAFYAGVPARKIKDIETRDQRLET